jgi:hypothetical protein
MVLTGPDSPPAVTSRTEPPPGPARLLAAVGGLALGGVDEPEAAAGLGDEGVGDRVAGSWHAHRPWYPPVATEKSGEPGKLLHPFAPVGGNPMDGMAFPRTCRSRRMVVEPSPGPVVVVHCFFDLL